MTLDPAPNDLPKTGSRRQRRQRISGLILSASLIAISVAAAVFCVLISSKRPLTALEGTLFQVLSLLAGLEGSYLFGLNSAREAAGDLVKPHARSSFRRVWSLYMSLSRLAEAIDRARSSQENASNQAAPLDTIQAIVVEQIATAGDALEDWRDVVPEDVEEVEKRLRSSNQIIRASRK